ncbi:MAG: hypothetical protein LBU34_12405, partial [Planctomycetaceae bacterium]|nr:hypothetical protein [Planctomycetaceae bacterium]
PETPTVTDEDFYGLCGKWESDQTAEEMIAELKAARHFREKDKPAWGKIINQLNHYVALSGLWLIWNPIRRALPYAMIWRAFSPIFGKNQIDT